MRIAVCLLVVTTLAVPVLRGQSSANFKLAEASSADPPQECASAGYRITGAVVAGCVRISTSRCFEIALGPVPTRLGELPGTLWDTDDDDLADGWEYFYVGNLMGLEGAQDRDGDGKNDLEELFEATDPTLASSVFRLTASERIPMGFLLEWTGGAGKVHEVEFSPDLQPGSWTAIASVVMPGSGSISYVDGDPGRHALPVAFYRVRVAR